MRRSCSRNSLDNSLRVSPALHVISQLPRFLYRPQRFADDTHAGVAADGLRGLRGLRGTSAVPRAAPSRLARNSANTESASANPPLSDAAASPTALRKSAARDAKRASSASGRCSHRLRFGYPVNAYLGGIDLEGHRFRDAAQRRSPVSAHAANRAAQIRFIHTCQL